MKFELGIARVRWSAGRLLFVELYDWVEAKRLYDKLRSFDAVAQHLGCSVGAVKAAAYRYDWVLWCSRCGKCPRRRRARACEACKARTRAGCSGFQAAPKRIYHKMTDEERRVRAIAHAVNYRRRLEATGCVRVGLKLSDPGAALVAFNIRKRRNAKARERRLRLAPLCACGCGIKTSGPEFRKGHSPAQRAKSRRTMLALIARGLHSSRAIRRAADA